MGWLTNNGWVYADNPSRLYRDVGLTNSLIFIGSNKTFKSSKGYLFKTKIRNLSNYGNNFTDYIIKKTAWNDTIDYNNLFYINSYNGGDGYLYFYSNPNVNTPTINYLTYKASESFDTNFGIYGTEIYEIDWNVNGYSYIGDDGPTYSGVPYNKSNGWHYSSSSDSFIWYDTEPTFVDEFGQVLQYCPPDQPLFNPVGSNGEILGNTTSVSCASIYIGPFKKINYLSRFVDYQFFNFELSYNKNDKIFLNNDPNAGLTIYTSEVQPYSGTSEQDFDNYINNCELIYSLTQSGTYSFYGLSGKKYLLLVADPATYTYSCSTLIELYNIKISGNYHPSNNWIYEGDLDIKFDDSILDGATFSFFSGSGNTIDDNILGITITSKVGNGTFKVGIWEDGVWNSGWRLDENVIELYDVIRSINVFSDSRWLVRISGLTSVMEDLKVGEVISIGNIISIDINENRKLLKDSYRILNKSQIDERLSYIEIMIETQFPVRRIEKDSQYHRIKVTKNIWLSGLFLNGYFTGIWNNGKFKGYPLITEMYNTNWIDGNFEGGHIKSEYYIYGTFSGTFKYGNTPPPKLGLSFTDPHNLKVGDIIEINKSDKTINAQYDGETIIERVLTDYIVITNKDYGKPSNGETGQFTTKITNSLIQNFVFDSKNASNITSVNSMYSPSIFIYNSWMDLVYDDYSAVNIGKPQNIINKASNKSYSENNLYGYPTNDVLSSNSKFRDSYSTENRIYKLGTKYKLFEDYIGDSSRFTEYFGTNSTESILFLNQGWTYSKYSDYSITFSRTESLGNTDILGEELKVEAISKGGVLDISDSTLDLNRSSNRLLKERYSIIEFDMVKLNIEDKEMDDFGTVSDAYYNVVDLPGTKIDPIYYVDMEQLLEIDPSMALSLIDVGKYEVRKEPLIHFDNINVTRRQVIEGSQSTTNIYEFKSTYLPIFENVNHTETRQRRKVEYFYNKKNLSINFRGNGFFGKYQSEYIINNLKLYEVNMIPFFQYFVSDNINVSIETPFQGYSPYISFNQDDYVYIDKSSIGYNSFFIQSSNNVINDLILGDDQ